MKNRQTGTGAVIFCRKGDRLHFVRKDLNGDRAGNLPALRHWKYTVSWLDFWMIGFLNRARLRKNNHC
jgi:hypothetical protein